MYTYKIIFFYSLVVDIIIKYIYIYNKKNFKISIITSYIFFLEFFLRFLEFSLIFMSPIFCVKIPIDIYLIYS